MCGTCGGEYGHLSWCSAGHEAESIYRARAATEREWEIRCEERVRSVTDRLTADILAMRSERDDAYRMLGLVADAWSKHWDCSAYPGHDVVHSVMNDVDMMLSGEPELRPKR